MQDRAAPSGDDGLDRIRHPPWRLGDGWRHELRRAVDLADVKQREGAQQRDALLAVLVGITGSRVAHLHPLEEIRRRAALALAHLPAAFGGLLVGGPARVGTAEGERRHAEDDRVDASVPGARDRVARHGGTARLVRVPGFAPWWGAGFESGDHPAGDLGVVVASFGHAAPTRCVRAHRVPLPSRVCRIPAPPRVRADRGKGAPLGASARARGPLRRSGRDAVAPAALACASLDHRAIVEGPLSRR